MDSTTTIDQLIDDAEVFIPTLLKVVAKSGTVVPLIPFETQRKVVESVKRQDAMGKPVRTIVLKCRQFGGTTIGEAITYHRTVKQPYQHSVCIADDETTSNLMLNMGHTFTREWRRSWERYQEDPDNNPPVPPPPLVKASNARRLIFADPDRSKEKGDRGLNSDILIQLGSDAKAGRGQMIRHLHASELPYWPVEAGKIMSGLLKCVPSLPGTTVILESTANGMGGYFYDTWMDAKSGRNDFDPIFVPWFDVKEYRYPAGVADLGRLDDYEQGLIRDYGLDLAQIAWYRWALINQCDNDPDELHKDYPSTEAEAFVSSGTCPFNARILKEFYVRHAQQPISQGSFDPNGTFDEHPNGTVKVWEWPVPGQEYVIGEDPARGVSKSKRHDYCSAKVWRVHPMNEVATWHGYVTYPEFAVELAFFGYLYNEAWIFGETNWGGISVLNKLADMMYPHIMYRDQWVGRHHSEDYANLGWSTTTRTKPGMVGDFATLIKEQEVGLPDRDTLIEMMEYEQVGAGKYQARKGGHDDRVIASMIAYQAALRRARTVAGPTEAQLERKVREEMFRKCGAQAEEIHRMNLELLKPAHKQDVRVIAAVYGRRSAERMFAGRRKRRRMTV